MLPKDHSGILSLVRLPIPPLSQSREYSLLRLITTGEVAPASLREFGNLHVAGLQQFAGGMGDASNFLRLG